MTSSISSLVRISKISHCIFSSKTLASIFYIYIWASVAQSSKRCPPTTEVTGSSLYQASDRMWKEFVNTLAKVVGFLWVLRFLPTGKNLTG